MRADLSGIVKSMKRDDRYRRLRQLFADMPLYKIPTQDLVDEILRIHSVRGVRFLTTSDAKFFDRVIDASIQDQANRSRLSEILMQCVRARGTLDNALSPLREYLLIRYANEITFLRTKDERVRVVNMALASFQRFLDKVDIVEQQARIVVEDIDKASFSLKRIIEAYTLHNKPEYSL